MKNRLLALFIAALGQAIFLNLNAATTADDHKELTPSEIQGGIVIDTKQAKAFLDAKDCFFLDTRSPINFGKGRIPSAKLVSYKEKSTFDVKFDQRLDKFDIEKLPKDKRAKIVFYSANDKGWKSYKAAVIAIKAGYKNIYWYRAGYADWIQQTLPIED